MARRPGGGRGGGRVVPGLSAALADYYRTFGQHWASARSLTLADSVDAGERVSVDGVTIWRALFDRRYPNDWAELMVDPSMYVVSADRFEKVLSGRS